jgi:hypothetical protein
MTVFLFLAFAIISHMAIVLVPVLTHYPGYVSWKVSFLGYKAESTVDGRKPKN